MINRVQIVGVYVSDQDRALAFFTETLGFELVADNPFGDGQRWLQVRPPPRAPRPRSRYSRRPA